MAKNHLLVTHEGDTIRLSWQRRQANPRFAPPVTFQHPFEQQALDELRWYLEEYLRFRYGLEPERAKKIEEKFQTWGQELFNLIFRSSDKAREFFQEATREGLDTCEIGIASDNPAVLNLPWELLYCPDYEFLAPSLAGIYRTLSSQAVRAEIGEMPQDKLNILLVIARPYERDIGFHTIARPMLEALKPIRQQINLKLLRPPSFQEFEKELNANKGFYHIVHFDGHGTFNSNAQGQQFQLGAEAQGELVFETLEGNAQVITAQQIAQSLANCRVPVFILNACKSAQEGEEKFSSVATRFIFSGAKGVVAMAYSVHAQAAKHFMQRLYGELAIGRNLAEAVAAARLMVLNQPMRQSPKGQLPLKDWLVPVLYQQESYTPFVPKQEALSFEALLAAAETENPKSQIDLPDASAYGFIGRDYEILRLERAFRQNHVVLLKGMGGIGKTELALGFARWLDETQGRTGGIFFTSFEQGVGLSQVINQIGRQLGGERFAQLMPDKQEKLMLEYLQANSCLLIWDNFEPVNGFPSGNEPLLSPAERDNLKRFLKNLRGGQTWVLITSRRKEDWLDCGYTLLDLTGLSAMDAEELAAKILQTAGVDRAKLPKEYLELLKLLGGHPLSLRVVLPHLKTQTPLQLIEALRQGLDTFQGAEEEGRAKSLTVSLDYSFAKLSAPARQHLPFLALFSERVDALWLHAFSNSPDDDFGQAYQAVFGENLQKTDWLRILDEAAEAGILEHLDETIYKIHPALPWYLRQRLVETLHEMSRHPQEIISKLEKKLLIFYAMLADNYREELISNAELATFILRVEEPNLLQNLRLAEQQQSWVEAQAILQFLGKLYERLDRKPEFRALTNRALNNIETILGGAKAKERSIFNFWIYLQGVNYGKSFGSRDLDKAHKIHQEILNELINLNDSSLNEAIAVAYHNLGLIAQEKLHFEAAFKYYNQAINIYSDTVNKHEIAGIYYQMGMVFYQQNDLQNSINYYEEALKIHENFSDSYESAHDYFGLGKVAQEQSDFNKAINYYEKALLTFKDKFDFHRVAIVCQQLGGVTQQLHNYEQSRSYYREAIKYFEDTQDDYNAAFVYHDLGTLSWRQQEQDFETAINYYKKAFSIFQKLQHWNQASITLGNWGRVLEFQEKWGEALKVYIQFWMMNIEHRLNWIPGSIKSIARMFKLLGKSQFNIIWREETGQELTTEWRSAIEQASQFQEE